MKKVIAIAAAAVLASGAFAEGFKLSGFVRAGWSNTIDALDTNADEDGDTAEASTATWLAGDYFGGSTRSRINLEWTNSEETAGAYFRLQYTGAAEKWAVGDVKYANAWLKAFDGKAVFAAGKVKDDYIGSDGYEGFSFLDGNSGFFAGVSPVEGLTIGGGAVVDYLESVETTTYKKEEGSITKDDGTEDAVTLVTKTTTSKHRASKRAAYAGAKYANDQFSVAGGYEFAGALYGNVNITAVKDLTIALEGAWASKDALDNLADGDDGFLYDSKLTFVEQVEYTGIENLTLALASYQWVNDRDVHESEDNFSATITPAVRYDINDQFAVSAESTITLNKWDEDKVGEKPGKTYATIVPAFYIKAGSGAELNVWGKISTDKDQDKNAVGVGGIFKF
ncbi:MAG: hypothetical protein K6G80_09535 [Treponema sp.]|nr:hypothetical protein [Treponema sp.]